MGKPDFYSPTDHFTEVWYRAMHKGGPIFELNQTKTPPTPSDNLKLCPPEAGSEGTFANAEPCPVPGKDEVVSAHRGGTTDRDEGRQ